ncbi:hypothetical protein NDN08_007182 [Rhodosorus marinus]|uniref:Cell division protein FtsL n=1 Tax=Rhodosorus marinus TaxID=101924 RepID=A0AAV8UFW0_9RHOD|nr:hypothetical protein NDN08_007182 [Rhodosorus marinus]
MAVPLKKRTLIQEQLMVAVLVGTLLMMVASYWVKASRIHFVGQEMERFKVENVGHEESISNLRVQYQRNHWELDKLKKHLKSRPGMALDTSGKTRDEHAPLAAEGAAETGAKAKANAADPPVRVDQVVNDASKDFVDETIVREAVDANV